MKIVISGVTGFRNRGVEALVQPIISNLHKIFPDAQIAVFTGSPDYDACRISSRMVRMLPEGYSHKKYNRLTRRLIRFGIDHGEVIYSGWEALEASDLLIVTGGDVFSSEYGDESFDRHLLPMRLALLHGVPFVLLAQSIGPFTSEKHRSSFSEVVGCAASISVREDRTYTYLTAELGISPDLVTTVSDPAFLLEADQRTSASVRKSPHDRPKVAISISEAISDWIGLGKETRVSTWAAICERMVSDWEVDILLIPHVQEPYADDRITCTEVWRASGFNPRIRVCAEDLSASEYKGMVSACDLVVAERMHAGIAGLSMGVCTVLVAYSVKARGIMDRMVGAEYAEQGALIEGSEFKDVETVWRKLSKVWDSRAAIANVISASLVREKDQAKRAFEDLSRFSEIGR